MFHLASPDSSDRAILETGRRRIDDLRASGGDRRGADGHRGGHENTAEGELDHASHDPGGDDQAQRVQRLMPADVRPCGEGGRHVEKGSEPQVHPQPPRQEPEQAQHRLDGDEGARESV
jgi:hypothetical protein